MSDQLSWKKLPNNPNWNKFIDHCNGRPNVLFLMTDQQRAPRHWPESWVDQKLWMFNKLKANGLYFKNNFIGSTPCTADRSVIMTGTYPPINGVPGVLLPFATSGNLPFPKKHAPKGKMSLENFATLFHSRGYRCSYHGKWHLYNYFENSSYLKMVEIMEKYGFHGYTPPDDGDNVGGKNSDPLSGGDAVTYLESKRKSDKPLFMVVSLINPHDISTFGGADFEGIGTFKGHVEPDKHSDEASFWGYEKEKVLKEAGSIARPVSWDDDILPQAGQNYNKPLAQQQKLEGSFDAQTADEYSQFYAYLTSLNEKKESAFAEIYNSLEGLGILDKTLIVRFSDHGEMGMAHKLKQKVYNCYQETMNVSLIFSNPIAFPEPIETDSFVSTADYLPTFASLIGTDRPEQTVGSDFSPVIENPESKAKLPQTDSFGEEEQDTVLFSTVYKLVAPNQEADVVCVNSDNGWKYAVYNNYSDSKYSYDAPQFELYNLNTDPNEMINLLANATIDELKDENGAYSAYRENWLALQQKLVDRLKHADVMPSWFSDVCKLLA